MTTSQLDQLIASGVQAVRVQLSDNATNAINEAAASTSVVPVVAYNYHAGDAALTVQLRSGHLLSIPARKVVAAA